MLGQTTLGRTTFSQSGLQRTARLPAMFADSMLQVSWDQRSRRSWTTLTSFGLQAMIVSLLLIAPLLRTVRLPSVHTVSTPISAGRHVVEPLAEEPHGHSFAGPIRTNAIVLGQSSHFHNVIPHDGEDFPGPVGDSGACSGCIATAGLPGGLNNIIGGDRPVPLPSLRPVTNEHPFRTSSMLQGYLLHAVQPVYPPIARTGRIQGTVVLDAIINKEGAIADLRVLSGHPMLVSAAIDAVKQWRYKPYILNNETIEVETRITVNFTLAGN